MQQWADDESRKWQTFNFDQFSLHATLQVKTQQALYYTAGGTRLLTIVLVRDIEGQRPDQIFYCTRLDWTAQKILSAYSRRWAIEVTFQNSKQHLGLKDPANRTPLAEQRTAPMARILYSLIVAWFHLAGHKRVKFPDRPWYTDKRESSYADMLTMFRQESWHKNLSPVQSASRLVKIHLARLVDFLSLAG